MRVRAAKVKKDKERKKAERKDKTKVYAFGVVFTALVFILLCVAQRVISDTGERANCYIASKNIIDGVHITKDNFYEYFTIDSRYVSELPVNWIKQPSDIYDSYTTRDYVANDVASVEGFKTSKSMIADIENPLEVSVSAGSLPQAVGGILRAGDKVNIMSVETVNVNGIKTEKVTYICKGAYIAKALNSNGIEVDRNSTDEAALIMNIVIPEDAEEEFTRAVMKGTIRMSKILENNSGDNKGTNMDNNKSESAENKVEEVNTKGEGGETSASRGK